MPARGFELSDNVGEGGRREPTMRDVAALAAVSLKTVSRVVNREDGVSSELRARVEEAVRLIGYRPNLTASSLRRSDRKTQAIGLLLEDVANPFSSALHRAVEDVAAARSCLVFAGSSDEDAAKEGELLRAFAHRRVDGLILIPAGGNVSGLADERRQGRPIVFVDRRAPMHDADSVTVDNREGVARAVRHLAGFGHRRIAFLADLDSIWTATERYQGFVDGLLEAQTPLVPELVRRDVHGIEPAEHAILELLRDPRPPTAILAGQNLITIGAIRALQVLGRQREVALIGFDDFTLADLLDPPVTVIAQDPGELGRVAAELLFARLEGEVGGPRHVVVPTRLVERGSGEIRPG